MRFSWLHLTDFHQDVDDQDWLWPGMQELFYNDLEKLHERCGPWDLILFTGDLTQQGSTKQFNDFEDQLQQLLRKLKELSPDTTPVFLAVPGNHDLVRPTKDTSERDVLLQWGNQPDAQKRFWENNISKERKIITEAFANYSNWWAPHAARLAEYNYKAGILPGDFSLTFEKEGAKLGILGLNSSFLQLQNGNYRERLALHVKQFHGACNNNGPVWASQHNACILMTHHPHTWLNKESRKNWDEHICNNERFAIHLCGHMHESAYDEVAFGGGAARRHFQGCSLFGCKDFIEGEGRQLRKHGYAAGCIELSSSVGKIYFWPRTNQLQGGKEQNIVPDFTLNLNEDTLSFHGGSVRLQKQYGDAASPHLPQRVVVPRRNQAQGVYFNNNIIPAISRGSLLPCLGPLCYAEPEHFNPALGHFKKRLNLLKNAIGVGAEFNFVESVAKSRIPQEAWGKLGQVDSSSPLFLQPPDGLHDFQSTCAKVGLGLSQALAIQMKEHPEGITNLGTHKVSLNDELIASILQDLSKGINLATTINENWQNKDVERLRCAECNILPCQAPCLLAAGIAERISAFKGVIDEQHGYFLSQLEWIGDLLWHTLRFDAPMIPDPEDLAFQLSLDIGTREASRYRPDVGNAAVSVNSKDSRISDWFKCYEIRHRKLPFDDAGLYAALARFLQYSPNPDTCRPTILNSNLDLEIEHVLDQRRHSYNVLLPVYVRPDGYGEDEDVPLDPLWMILTRNYSGSGYSDKWILLSTDGILKEGYDQLSNFPLIVKLRGSPCHSLPDKDEITYIDSSSDDVKDISHRIYLSDDGFFPYMLQSKPTDRLPKFLADTMRKSHWCLLGYPLPDPHFRLTFHDHIRYFSERRPPIIFADYPHDPFNQNLADKTEITYFEMSISQFASKLDPWLKGMGIGVDGDKFIVK